MRLRLIFKNKTYFSVNFPPHLVGNIFPIFQRNNIYQKVPPAGPGPAPSGGAAVYPPLGQTWGQDGAPPQAALQMQLCH